MKNPADFTRTSGSPTSGSRITGDHGPAPRAATATLILGLLLGLGACVGTVDPIIRENPEERDPTDDPADDTSFQGSMSEVRLAFATQPDVDFSST